MSENKITLPYRLALCGEYIDCCYVNMYSEGSMITVMIKPTHEFAQRCGMATGTRYVASLLWGDKIPDKDKNELAQDLFKTETESFKTSVGVVDALGMVFPGCCKIHFKKFSSWADTIETISDQESLQFIKDHVFLIQLHPRIYDFSVFNRPTISPYPVNFIAQSSEMCWEAIKERNVEKLGEAMNMCYKNQVAIFPLIETDEVFEARNKLRSSVYGSKLTGAGGGGYLIVIADTPPENALQIEPVGLN